MFGRHVEREYRKQGAVVEAVEVVYEAFMENEGEFVITQSVGEVEVKRVVIKEAYAYALAEMFANNP